MHGVVLVRLDVTLNQSSHLSDKCLELRSNQGEMFEIWRKIESIYVRAAQKNPHFPLVIRK